jgi:carboxylesterase
MKSYQEVFMVRKAFGVLILHGFTSSLDTVKAVEPPMQALGLPTSMPVLRGHCAASPDALKGVNWQDWVADGEAALQELLKKVDKVIIVGLSMGGQVALILAADHPAEVDSIVLAAASVQLVNPLAPHRPLNFLVPIVKLLFKTWKTPPVRADKSLLKYNTNYTWAPADAIFTFLDFGAATIERLPDVKVPALILQSRNDHTVLPESANIIYNSISTPGKDKKIIWYEVTDHEMFMDCEVDKIVADIVGFVKKRIAKKS